MGTAPYGHMIKDPGHAGPGQATLLFSYVRTSAPSFAGLIRNLLRTIVPLCDGLYDVNGFLTLNSFFCLDIGGEILEVGHLTFRRCSRRY